MATKKLAGKKQAEASAKGQGKSKGSIDITILDHSPAKAVAGEDKDVAYKKAKENMVDIQKNKIIISHGYMMLAKALYEHKMGEMFKTLGHETFEDFLAQPEISIPHGTAYDLIKAYRMFVIELKFTLDEIQSVDVTKTKALLRIDIPNKTSAKEWIHKATTLSRSDLITAIQEYQGKDPEHSKRTQSEDAWQVLKHRLEGRTRNSWFKTKDEISSIGCSACGKECDTSDVILSNDNFKLIVVKCLKCKKEELVIFA